MRIIGIACLLILLAAGCRTPNPTAIAATTQAIPTFTPSPLPPTPTPTLAGPTQDLLTALVPHSTPAEHWMDIPIMPGALRGEGDEFGYTFTTLAAPEQIREFYQKQLAELGWEYLPYAEGDTGTSMMVFRKAEETLIISVHAYEGEGMMVVIVR